MYKRIAFIILLSAKLCALSAQIFPSEYSVLNYRLVGFSFPAKKGITKYKIDLANGQYNNEDSFKSNIVSVFYCEENKKIETVPAFGAGYTWRISYLSDNSIRSKSQLYHFNTGSIQNVDTSNNRLRIIKYNDKYKDDYVFLDGPNVLYDMMGNPVWYLPGIENSDPDNLKVRDLKITKRGTITFLTVKNIFEINYNGNILWQGPKENALDKDNALDYYHHQFTRLDNGNYMSLINDVGVPPLDSLHKQTFKDTKKNSFGAVIEYDHNNNVVWAWKSSKFFEQIPPEILKSYFYDTDAAKVLDVHLNAFFFDEKTNEVYLSFKNISSIIKIKYPEGNVIAVYGNLSTTEQQNDLFCGQHSCNISMDGYLYLFNNNSCNAQKAPKIIMMEQPTIVGDTLKKIWEFTFPPDQEAGSLQQNIRPQSDKMVENVSGRRHNKHIVGGNVIELPDSCLFTSISGNCGKVLIIGRDKNILWSAVSEKKVPDENYWLPNDLYRASSVTSRKNLEQLIWNAEK